MASEDVTAGKDDRQVMQAMGKDDRRASQAEVDSEQGCKQQGGPLLSFLSFDFL